MRRRSFLAMLATGSLGSVGGCAALATGSDYDVGMTAVAFDPIEVVVAPGERVRWRNTSSRSHTVTAAETGLPDGASYFASGGFETEAAARSAWESSLSGAIESGESYTHRFEVAGTYEYVCIPHERAGMVGRVVADPAAARSPGGTRTGTATAGYSSTATSSSSMSTAVSSSAATSSGRASSESFWTSTRRSG